MQQYKITLKLLDPQPVATIRRTCLPVELGTTLGEILPEIWAFLQNQDVYPSGPPFARYHHVTEDEVDLEAGYPVKEPVEPEGDIQASELPGGNTAVTWHIGSYEHLRDAYAALAEWIQAKDLHARGAPWEVYHTDPDDICLLYTSPSPRD